jgi:AAA domain/Domain of unknown function (DUF5710)/ATP-dependent RecD-like DNA helicase SH3 domain/UvrD-like helicase C-terminal domain
MFRVYVSVPFSKKEEAKILGARWDSKKKLWFAQHSYFSNLIKTFHPVCTCETDYCFIHKRTNNQIGIKIINKYLREAGVKGFGEKSIKKMLERNPETFFEVITSNPNTLDIPKTKLQELTKKKTITKLISLKPSYEKLFENPELFGIVKIKNDKDFQKFQKYPYEYASNINKCLVVDGYVSKDTVQDRDIRFNAWISAIINDESSKFHGAMYFEKDRFDDLNHQLEIYCPDIKVEENDFVWTEDRSKFTTSYLHEMETKVSEILLGISNRNLEKLEMECPTELNEEQKTCFNNFTEKPLTILRGGPGTGKTFTVMKIFVALRENFIPYAILSSFGVIRGKYSERGAIAYTIDKFLYSHLEDELENNTCFLFDESSTLPLDKIYSVLKIIQGLSGSRILFCGDENQLHGIGIGNFFYDVISSNRFPETHLINCIRSTEDISVASKSVLGGETPTNIEIKSYSDTEDIFNAWCFPPGSVDPPLVITQFNIDKDEINSFIQRKTKCQESGCRLEFKHFHDGDPVMNTENDYEINVMNGDIGKIERYWYDFENRESNALVEFGDKVVRFRSFPEAGENAEQGDIRNLELAYSISVHKSQGAERDRILYVLSNRFSRNVSRRVIYTAITRAKTECVILCQPEFKFAEALSKEEDIFTMLRKKLIEIS